jgi:hypothetical protein
MEAYGMAGLVGVIKARVQEHDGKLVPVDAASEMRRVQRERAFLLDREHMMSDQRWIQATVHTSIKASLAEVIGLMDDANTKHGFDIVGRANDKACVLRSGFVSLSIGFRQPYINRVTNDECYLGATEFSGIVLLPGENGWVMHKPQELKSHKLMVDISETRQLVWKEAGKKTIIPADKLGDHLFRIFLSFLSRANQGKVPRPDL